MAILDNEGEYPDSPTTLDEGTELTQLTRHILVSYKFKFVETENSFMLKNTFVAFAKDLKKNKRRTEVIHIEPQIEINTNISGQLTSEWYHNYDHTLSGAVYSKLTDTGKSLLDVAFIVFGNDKLDYTEINDSITTVNDSTKNILSLADNCQVISQSSGVLDVRNQLTFVNKFDDYNEIALWDENSGCLYYASIPDVEFSSKYCTNARITVNLI